MTCAGISANGVEGCSRTRWSMRIFRGVRGGRGLPSPLRYRGVEVGEMISTLGERSTLTVIREDARGGDEIFAGVWP
jgi:hypothetical protein